MNKSQLNKKRLTSLKVEHANLVKKLKKEDEAFVKSKNSSLKEMGFNIDESNLISLRKKIKEIEEKIILFERSVKMILENEKRYPGYAFIHFSDLRSLVNEYDMMLDQSSYYKGKIPEKNKEDLVKFKNKFTIKISRDPLTRTYNKKEKTRYYVLSEPKTFDLVNDRHSGGYDGRSNKIIESNYDISRMSNKPSPPDPVIFLKTSEGFIIITRWLPSSCDEKKDLVETNRELVNSLSKQESDKLYI